MCSGEKSTEIVLKMAQDDEIRIAVDRRHRPKGRRRYMSPVLKPVTGVATCRDDLELTRSWERSQAELAQDRQHCADDRVDDRQFACSYACTARHRSRSRRYADIASSGSPRFSATKASATSSADRSASSAASSTRFTNPP